VTHDLTPTVRVTRYEVSCLPEDDPERFAWTLTVEYRGRDLWAVCRMGQCLGTDGQWDYEPRPSGREDDWLKTHCFDLDTALRLAEKAAPHIVVSGLTPAGLLAWRKEREQQ